ncbi:MAG: TetR family transcriptional regulator C-terminal domain-containing protein [Pseudomonadota bacterium]
MTTTEQRPRTQPEINEYRRRLLMEATIDMLAKKGVAGATVRAITKQAGTSHGLIGHYYANKDELLVAALQHLFGRIVDGTSKAIAAAGDDMVARLYAWPRGMFSTTVFSPTNRAAFLALWHEIRFNPAVRDANRELYIGYRERAEKLFARAAVQLGCDIDASRAALGLVALIDGLWLDLSLEVGAVDRKGAIQVCHDFIDERLKG